MENFDFDNKFKEGLDNINPMLDNDEIWDNIEPHLKKKKKRRFVIWFFIGILGVLGLFWLQSADSSNETTISELNSKKEVVSNPIAQNIDNNNSEIAKNETTQIADETIINRSETQKAVVQKSAQEAKSPPSIEYSTKDQPSRTNQSIEGKNIERISTQEIPLENKDGLNFDKSTTPEKSKLTYLPDVKNPNKVVDVKIEAEINKLDKTPLFEPSLPATIEGDQIKPEVTASKEEVENTDITITIPEEKQEVKKKPTKKERQEANKKRKEARKKAKKEREKKKKEDKKKAESKKNKLTKPNKRPNWKHQFQMMGSGIYTLHHLRDGNRSESTYLRNRDKYVKGTEGFGTSIQFVTENPSGLLLTAGIQYQQLHEKLERLETISKSRLQDVTVTVTEDAEGKVIGSTSSMQLVTTTTTYNQQLFNQYRFLNFPIGIGYAFKSNKTRLKLIGGIDLNAYYKFTGSIFNRDLNIIELKSKSSGVYNRIYKNQVGMGIWATVEWHKPINERLSLVVAPGIQAPLKSITQNSDDWQIAQNIFKLKLGVGINYLIEDSKKSKKRSRKG